MHHGAYVLLSKAEATTSLEARQQVYHELLNDPSFLGEGGRFSTPVCDWFDIGGRWSGWLYSEPLRNKFFRQADQLNSLEKEPGWYSTEFIKNNHEQLDAIWHKLGGAYASPLTRDSSDGLGEEDDACLLDQSLAERLNVFLQASDEYINTEEYCITRKAAGSTLMVISLDCDALFGLTDFNDLIGKYWVVVIDYHT